jgi:hypothetical protein
MRHPSWSWRATVLGSVLLATACRNAPAAEPARRPAPPTPPACASHAAPATLRSAVLVMIGGMFTPDHVGPDAFERQVQEARSHAAAYLDALDDVLGGASDDALSSLLPTVLFSLLSPHADRHAHASAQCALARYQAATARARVAAQGHRDDALAWRLQRLETMTQGLGARAQAPILCVAERCAAGEICVHPTCVGPCTPAAPYCAPAARISRLCADQCPCCRRKGDDLICGCP